jgi:hypothetical protein
LRRAVALAAALPLAAGPAVALDLYQKSGQFCARCAMLLPAQAEPDGRFKQRCAGCHGSAAALARKRLEFRGGVLYGATSKRAVAEFLPGHTSLSREDARFFTELLERVERETAGPQKKNGQ